MVRRPLVGARCCTALLEKIINWSFYYGPMKTISPKMRSIKPGGTTAALGARWVPGVEQGAASRPGSEAKSLLSLS